MYKLIDREPRGAGTHRAGWPAVVEALKPRVPIGNILLDDFVEQSVDEDKWDEHGEPWVGIFHHPYGHGHPDPNKRTLPQNFARREDLEPVFSRLRLAFALSTNQAVLLTTLLPRTVDIRVVRHPIDELPAELGFDPERLKDPKLRVIQAGTYMRNIRGIHQIPASDEWERLRTWIPPYYKQLDARLLGAVETPEHAGVIDMPKLTDSAYDSMLSRSVIFAHYFDASASNTVLECIQRATPLVLNRLPAHEEYLGPEYPGFYTDIDEVPGILRDRDRLLAAHQYLLPHAQYLIRLHHFVEFVGNAIAEKFRMATA